MGWIATNYESGRQRPYDEWAAGRIQATDWQTARDSLMDAAIEWLELVENDDNEFQEVQDDARALVDALTNAKPGQGFHTQASFGYRMYQTWLITEVG